MFKDNVTKTTYISVGFFFTDSDILQIEMFQTGK